MKVGQVAAKITSQSAIKLNVTLVAALIKYACDLGLGDLVDELVADHCREVNPNDTTVPHSLFDELAKSIPKKYVLCKKVIALEAYSREKLEEKVRPLPDIGKFITMPEVMVLGKNLEKLEALEEWLRKSRLTVAVDMSKTIILY